MGRGPILKRQLLKRPSLTDHACAPVSIIAVLAPLSRMLSPTPRAGYPRVTHPFATLLSFPKDTFSFDLHVLGTPPAFVLSQDQTLHKEILTQKIAIPNFQRSLPILLISEAILSSFLYLSTIFILPQNRYQNNHNTNHINTITIAYQHQPSLASHHQQHSSSHPSLRKRPYHRSSSPILSSRGNIF